jgi:hypothetical protein
LLGATRTKNAPRSGLTSQQLQGKKPNRAIFTHKARLPLVVQN